MNEGNPTFFAGRRLSVYFKGRRLLKDSKTGQRFWRLKWALTLKAADAYACRGAILSTYEHIQARENAAEEIILSGCRGEMIVRAFALADGDDEAYQIIRLDRCFLDKFRMTYADEMTEFWIEMTHELTDSLHKFVKDYAFQRFWVEFEAAQRTLVPVADGPLEKAIDRMQKLADEDGVSTRITSEGKTLAEFKPKGKVQ